MKNTQQKQYATYDKPSWAPPSWVFGPVWTILYSIIAITFGYVAYQVSSGAIPIWVLIPFALNIASNVLYTPLQFRFRTYVLAAIDVGVVATSLLWAMIVVYPYAPWVSISNIPYLLWSSFALCLQIAVAKLNYHKR